MVEVDPTAQSQTPRDVVDLPDWPVETVRAAAAGRHIWLAGGAVRDLILGRTPADWDFVTDWGALSLARSVADALGGAYYPLDEARGTGRAIVNSMHDGSRTTLDFAELRGADIDHDLRLRDFTINALGADLCGRLLDPTGGRQDLLQAVVRSVGQNTFAQDPVRLIRAIRQSVELGFALAPETRDQIAAEAVRVTSVAAERIRSELVRLMALQGGPACLANLGQLGVLPAVLPELCAGSPTGHSPGAPDPVLSQAVGGAVRATAGVAASSGNPIAQSDADNWATRIGRTTERVYSSLADYWQTQVDTETTRGGLVAWSALFLCAGLTSRHEVATGTLAEQCAAAAADAERALSRLRFSRAAGRFVTQTIVHVAAFEDIVTDASPLSLHRYFRESREAGIAGALLSAAVAAEGSFAPAALAEQDDHPEAFAGAATAYLTQYGELIAPPTLLSGSDLIALGVPEGPRIGELLLKLRERQVTGALSTQADAIAWVNQEVSTR